MMSAGLKIMIIVSDGKVTLLPLITNHYFVGRNFEAV